MDENINETQEQCTIHSVSDSLLQGQSNYIPPVYFNYGNSIQSDNVTEKFNKDYKRNLKKIIKKLKANYR